MGHSDDILAAISQIHAAGLDSEKWPSALSHITTLVGGHGASLELMERPSLRHRGMYSYGLPTAELGSYLEYYAPMCPRLPYAASQPSGSLIYDALYTTDNEMDSNPFFMEFLAKLDMRYGLGAVIAKSATDLVVTGVQISPKQGHPTKETIKLFGVLLPHVQQAIDVMRRLAEFPKAQAALENTLNWLVDGALVLCADGSAGYVNTAAQAIFRANDGITMRRGFFKFASGEATKKLDAAMKSVVRLRQRKVEDTIPFDFPVARRSGGPAYILSVRPLLEEAGTKGAVAIIFIRDPLSRKKTSFALLGEMFRLTVAEAKVATALCAGLSPDDYARENELSSNTVYTHIRHLKEKTGSGRMAELIRKLNDVQGAVALNSNGSSY